MKNKPTILHLVGTSGFSYKEWKGTFYPEDLPAAKMLSFYASRLPAVEINNTFYRMPKREVLAGWKEQTPDGFQFSIKASRRITHAKAGANISTPLGYLAENVQSLGDSLGTVLFQMPPWARTSKDVSVQRVQTIVDEFASVYPTVIEFRHASWFDADWPQRLADANVATVINDDDQSDDGPPASTTGPFGYLRLRRSHYSDDDLAAWIQTIQDSGWDRVFVFFKHEDEGTGPQLAARFLNQVT